MKPLVDTIIIGGGAAGLAAAIVLARARRSVIIIDNQRQSNRVSHAAHGVFGFDTISPAELYKNTREQLSTYDSVCIIDATVTNASRTDHAITVSTDNKLTYTAHTLLLAQGVTHALPDIPGLQEIWGTKAWHCPYCDGYEHRDEKLLVLTDSGGIDHMSTILPTWSTNLSYACPEDTISPVIAQRVKETGASFVGAAVRITPKPDSVHVVHENNIEHTYDSIVIGPSVKPRDDIATQLNCKLGENACVRHDKHGRTNQPGIYVAGDQAGGTQQVTVASASGHLAAVAIHEDLASRF